MSDSNIRNVAMLQDGRECLDLVSAAVNEETSATLDEDPGRAKPGATSAEISEGATSTNEFDTPSSSKMEVSSETGANTISQNNSTEENAKNLDSNEPSSKLDKETLETVTPILSCPGNSRSHAPLLSFDLSFCPNCGQNLSPLKHKTPPDIESEGGKAPDKPAPDVIYKVQFLEEGGGESVIATKPLDEPFDAEAMGKGEKMQKKSVIEVTTMLQISVPRHTYLGPNIDLTGGEISRILNSLEFTWSVQKTKLTIWSPALIQTLNKIVSHYPDVSLVGNSITLEGPYALLAHHMGELEAYKKTFHGIDQKDNNTRSHSKDDTSQPGMCNEETYKHIEILQKFLEVAYKDKIRKEEARYAKNPGFATFPMLWLLLKPGATVYHQINGEFAAFVIHSVKVDGSILESAEKLRPYAVKLWYLDFDGRFLGRCATTVDIYPFDGERKITSLKVFPCEFLDKMDGGKTRERLGTIGKRFYELVQGGQVLYSGNFWGSQDRKASILSIAT
jgi:hypothetical protein